MRNRHALAPILAGPFKLMGAQLHLLARLDDGVFKWRLALVPLPDADAHARPTQQAGVAQPLGNVLLQLVARAPGGVDGAEPGQVSQNPS